MRNAKRRAYQRFFTITDNDNLFKYGKQRGDAAVLFEFRMHMVINRSEENFECKVRAELKQIGAEVG